MDPMECDEPTYLGLDGLEKSGRIISSSLILKGLYPSLDFPQLLLSRSLSLFEFLESRLFLLNFRECRIQRRSRFRNFGLELSDGSFLRQESLVRAIQLWEGT